MQETWVRPLGWEDTLEKGMASHSSILAWRIPWTEEPGGLFIESQRVKHDWRDWARMCATFIKLYFLLVGQHILISSDNETPWFFFPWGSENLIKKSWNKTNNKSLKEMSLISISKCKKKSFHVFKVKRSSSKQHMAKEGWKIWPKILLLIIYKKIR